MPPDNKKQLLQQAMVTYFKYGLFVTAVLTDDKSQIVQQVIIRFSQNDKDGHFQGVNDAGEALIGWLYNAALLERGFLKSKDCPDLLNEDQANICISHYPMRCVVYMKIMNGNKNGHFRPLLSIGGFKHFQQYNYNKSKWVLDKATEMQAHVSALGMQV